MTDVLGFAAWLLLPLFGLWVWRFRSVARMDRPARVALALAAGALTVVLVMCALSLFNVEWSRTSVLLPLTAIAAAGVAGARGRRIPTLDRRSHRPSLALLGTVGAWLLTVYGTVTARESCGDLYFGWGAKAVRFFRAGGIDAAVLHRWPLTPDYPPLQTLLLAFSNTFSHQMSWWAAVLASPLFLLATLVILRSWSRDDITTFLAAATLAYAFSMAYPAGCAEPPLLLFETIALGGLTFLSDSRARTFCGAFGLAGAVFTKVEGATFAIAVVLAILVVERNPRRALAVFVPAALLLGGWLLFVIHIDMLQMYGTARLPLYPAAVPLVAKTLLKVMTGGVYGLPWIAAAAVIVLGDLRRAALPAVVALLTFAATFYFYLRVPDPVWWIESSAPRVLLAPLLSLLIAAGAAHQPESHAADL